MNDVRARFLKSILEQLPAERIVELHFFTPIRQGQIETGVAVIAAEPERPLPVAVVSVEGEGTPLSTEDTEDTEHAEDTEELVAAEYAEDDDEAASVDDLTAEDDPEVEAVLDDETVLVIEEAVSGTAGESAEAAVPASDDDSPYAEGSAASFESAAAPAAAPAPRFEVITAVYRWTRKGPERGKWEVDVTTEADAPLPTVGTVVKGVHDRAGEELEPQRLTNAELLTLLGEPTWQTTP